MLAEAGISDLGHELVSVDAQSAEAVADWGNLRTPETYLGYERTEHFFAHWNKLTRHFGEQGITANAVNPGGVLTGLQQSLSAEERRARYYDAEGNLLPGFKTPEQGAATSVWASVAPELEGIGGLYLEDCQQAIPYDPKISTLTGYMPYALNVEHAEQLWTISQQIVER